VHGSAHGKQIRFFDVEPDKIAIGNALSTCQRILADWPAKIA
jgi:hypothetical protein